MKNLRKRLAILLAVMIFATLSFGFTAQAFSHNYGVVDIPRYNTFEFTGDGYYLASGQSIRFSGQSSSAFLHSTGVRNLGTRAVSIYRHEYLGTNPRVALNVSPAGRYRVYVRNDSGSDVRLQWAYVFF